MIALGLGYFSEQSFESMHHDVKVSVYDNYFNIDHFEKQKYETGFFFIVGALGQGQSL